MIKNFTSTPGGKEILKNIEFGGGRGRPAYSSADLDMVKAMQPGDCVVIPNGSTSKKKGTNWKPYSYGRKFAVENGWILRSVTIGSDQYLVRFESDGKRRHP